MDIRKQNTPSYTIPTIPTTTPPTSPPQPMTPLEAASAVLPTVNGPTACVFALLLSVVISGGGVPVVIAGTISVFASCVVVCVPVADGPGGVTVWGGANCVFVVRRVV